MSGVEMISSVVVNQLISNVSGEIAKKIVVETVSKLWGMHSARRLQILLESINDGLSCNDEKQIEELLSQITSSTEMTTNLSDVINSSLLGKSKKYAPQICGILVAKAINSRSILTEIEEKYIVAVSELYDDEIRILHEFLKTHPRQVYNPAHRAISELTGEESPEFRVSESIEDDIPSRKGSAYFSLAKSIGRWAVVFESFDILEIQQTDKFEFIENEVIRHTKVTLFLQKEIRELERYLDIVSK